MIYPVSGGLLSTTNGEMSWRFKCGMGRIKEILSPTESPPQPTTIVAGSTVAYNITRYHYDIYIYIYNNNNNNNNNIYIYTLMYIYILIYNDHE